MPNPDNWSGVVFVLVVELQVGRGEGFLDACHVCYGPPPLYLSPLTHHHPANNTEIASAQARDSRFLFILGCIVAQNLS